jgi:outer membrane protein
MRNVILFITVFLLFQNVSLADTTNYLDFKYVLNNSEAGKKAQIILKKNLSDGLTLIKKKETSIQEEEKKIIQQKKLITEDEYKKKVTSLRKKVSELQKERKKILENISKKRSKAKSELLKNLNPIIQEYMIEKQVRLVVDSKSVILGDEKLDITKEITNRLNKKVSILKLN